LLLIPIGGAVKEEGWYVDPYRLHEARWFSDGTPTALVRDHGITSKDPPPDTPYLDKPEPIPEAPSLAADDLRRADDKQSESNDAVEAAWEIFTESNPD
jgi:hypothetical protein